MDFFRSHRPPGSVSLALATTAAILLAGCGGGSGDSSASSVEGTISGNVVKGPVAGAAVAAHRITNGTIGPALASTTTDAHGAFTMVVVGDLAGPVMLRMSGGGTYTDEASGAQVTMAGGDVMTAAIPHMAAGSTLSGVQVTPLTSMAQARANCMAGGLTPENIAAANTAIGDYFMVHDVLHTPPMNPLIAGSAATATPDMVHHGMALAAMSQYARDMGMQTLSSVVASMMSDVCDGVMDGLEHGTPIPMGPMMGAGTMHPDAGALGVADAMRSFVDTSHNVSGITLTQMAELMQRLASSDGHIHH
jgi:hypothetical protein